MPSPDFSTTKFTAVSHQAQQMIVGHSRPSYEPPWLTRFRGRKQETDRGQTVGGRADSSTLPAELQRLLNTIRELDERSQAMINQSRQQTKYCLGLASQGGKFSKKGEEEEVFEKLRKEIEGNQDNALSLCTEKVLLARQAHDLIDSHIKRLDEDLNNFAEDLKQEGKIVPEEPAVLPPLPLVPKIEKRRTVYGTPQSKRPDNKERDWDRERDRDFELMPPPGSLKKEFASPVELDQPIDPNEPTYCVCHQVSFGDMIACDNDNCLGGEWFHYSCVGLTPETRFKGKWYCPTCRQLPR
ncbi:inhibitor of growth protein [Striga asiatica]|uniref:PHD finger protein ING n=1 Tax=Striga asiatica TaxID=4170 RepID=A0A5A7R2H2_STRAF|nr:inhibitor of growth protein [Striga asiatica]